MSRNRASRALPIALAVGLLAPLLLAGPAVSAPLEASTSSTSPEVFSNTVSAAGPTTRAHQVVVAAPEIVTVTLAWVDPTADLNLYLYTPAGPLAASSVTASQPETVTYNASVTGTYKLLVKAATGSSAYTATVTRSPAAALAGTAWLDAAPADGVRAESESVLAGVVVQAFPAGSTKAVATATTSALGTYSFPGLSPGDYVVQFAAPVDHRVTAQDQGIDDTVDSDVDPGTGRSGTVTVAPGETGVVDAGFVEAKAVTDTFSATGNASGAGFQAYTFTVQEPGPISVALDWVDASADLNVFLYDPSGAQKGAATSTSKRPEKIDVVTDVTGVWKIGVRTRLGSSAYTATVSHSPGGNPNATIGDRVWIDTNRDGVQTDGEAGLPGTTVQLIDSTGTSVAQQTTDEQGAYRFEGITPGAYSLLFTLPEKHIFTRPRLGGDAARDSDADALSGRTPQVLLSAGQVVDGWDAGAIVVDGTQIDTFTGQVDQAATVKSVAHPIELGKPGRISVHGDWSNTSADVTLIIQDPTGAQVAINNTTQRPKTLVFDAAVAGRWKVVVRAKVGATSYTLTVERPVPPPPLVRYSGVYGFSGPAETYPYGMDFDSTDGTVLVGDYWNSRVKRFSADGVFLGVVSQKAPIRQDGGICVPYDVEADPDGNVWVADQNCNRVVQFDHNGNWMRTIGNGGSPDYPVGCTNGRMTFPTHVMVDPTTRDVFVTDPRCRAVHVFDSNGVFKLQFDWTTAGLSQYAIPRGIDYDNDGNIYVVEHNSRSVVVFDTSGVYLRKFAPRMDMNDPRGLAVDRTNGFVYVVGAYQNYVFQFRLDGSFVRRLSHSGDTRFDSVRFPAADDNGNLWVSDTWGYKIHKFNSSGVVQPWATGAQPPPPGGYNLNNGVTFSPEGKLYVVDTYEQRIQRFDTTRTCPSAVDCTAWELQFGQRTMAGSESEGLGYPRELTFGEGSVWVGDNNNAVVRYTPDGTFVARFGSQGFNPGQFRGGVQGLAVANGKVYATDVSNCRLQVFTLEGTLLSHMGSCGTDPGQMREPRGVVMDGTIAYVADSSNSRIAVWDTETGVQLRTMRPSCASQPLRKVMDVTLDPGGSKLYLTDQDNGRIVRFAKDGSGSCEVVSDGVDTPQGALGIPRYLEFGPDGRLYVSTNNRRVYAFTVL